VPLAAAGHEVVGVDIDPEMLERARATWREQQAMAVDTGSLTLIQNDVTALDLGRRFDLVILGFNSLLVMGAGDPAAQRATLKNMRRHLPRDGRAVIDTWLPTAADLKLYDGRVIAEWTRTDPETGDQVSKSVRATFDPGTRRATIDTHFDAVRAGQPPQRVSRRDEVHFPTRGELFEMLHTAGLEPQQIAGGYDMSPLDPDSERVIVVAAIGHSAPDSDG